MENEMKALIATALIFAATAASAYTTTNCYWVGSTYTCTTIGGGTMTTTNCTTYGGVISCTQY
jgi:cytochrome c oxidase assembly factor CtaG